MKKLPEKVPSASDRLPKPVPLIRLEKVVKRYPVGMGEFYQALNGIDLTINQGEFVAIMGPSGSGKSTLMHILGALDTPSSGRHFFKGKDITSYSEDQLAQIRNRDIGFVFQFFNLLPRITVFKNVERPLLYAGVPANQRQQKVLAALKTVGIADKAQNPANHISGGQIQRVAIARALIMEPSLILADEPTGNLDTRTSHEIMEILRGLNREGHTIVIITHEPDIAQFAKRQIKLIDGQITNYGV
jgi:putative ABC transport system ATP-binding protein